MSVPVAKAVPVSSGQESFYVDHLSGINPNEPKIKDFLKGQGWPLGLQDVLVRSLEMMPIRF